MTVMDLLRRHKKQEERTASEAWATLVDDLAADRDIPLEDVHGVLALARKTVDELERDVQARRLLRQRAMQG